MIGAMMPKFMPNRPAPVMGMTTIIMPSQAAIPNAIPLIAALLPGIAL